MRPYLTVKEKSAVLLDEAMPIPDTGCRLCMCRVDAGGYGSLEIKGRHMKAHRVVWQAERGEIPSGFQVLHDCDTPSCLNIDHLHLGTLTDNMHEKVDRKRAKSFGVPQKLTTTDAKDIRSYWAAGGVTQQELADKYGVTQGNIGHVIARRSFAHV